MNKGYSINNILILSVRGWMSNNLSPTVIIQVYEIPGIENYVLIMINEYQNYEAVR